MYTLYGGPTIHKSTSWSIKMLGILINRYLYDDNLCLSLWRLFGRDARNCESSLWLWISRVEEKRNSLSSSQYLSQGTRCRTWRSDIDKVRDRITVCQASGPKHDFSACARPWEQIVRETISWKGIPTQKKKGITWQLLLK